MKDELSKEVFFSYKIVCERTRKRWPFNTDGSLIQVVAWEGCNGLYFYAFIQPMSDTVTFSFGQVRLYLFLYIFLPMSAAYSLS